MPQVQECAKAAFILLQIELCLIFVQASCSDSKELHAIICRCITWYGQVIGGTDYGHEQFLCCFQI